MNHILRHYNAHENFDVMLSHGLSTLLLLPSYVILPEQLCLSVSLSLSVSLFLSLSLSQFCHSSGSNLLTSQRGISGLIPLWWTKCTEDRIQFILSRTQTFLPPNVRSVDTASNGYRGKGGQWVDLTTLPLLYADCLGILGSSTTQKPKGLPRPVKGWLQLYFGLFLSISLCQHSMLTSRSLRPTPLSKKQLH
jgi:hypothetical protein